MQYGMKQASAPEDQGRKDNVDRHVENENNNDGGANRGGEGGRRIEMDSRPFPPERERETTPANLRRSTLNHQPRRYHPCGMTKGK